MRFRGLLIAVVVLAALGGGVYWSNKVKKAEEGKPAAGRPAADPHHPGGPVPADRDPQGRRRPPGAPEERLRAPGRCSRPRNWPVDQDAANGVVTTLASLSFRPSGRGEGRGPGPVRPGHVRRSKSPSAARTARRRSCSWATRARPAEAASPSWTETRGSSPSPRYNKSEPRQDAQGPPRQAAADLRFGEAGRAWNWSPRARPSSSARTARTSGRSSSRSRSGPTAARSRNSSAS